MERGSREEHGILKHCYPNAHEEARHCHGLAMWHRFLFALLYFVFEFDLLFLHFLFFALAHSISFHLGASITACRMAERHIVALEQDSEIFEAVLLPMRNSIPPAEPVVAHPDPSSTKPRQKLVRHHRKCA
jgi:hypothetical protein